MELGDYQRSAAETIRYERGGDADAAVAPMLGLASETGTILDVYKKYLGNRIDLEHNRQFLRRELGDLLWYLAAIATAFKLDLDDIAALNLDRVRDRFPSTKDQRQRSIPVLDKGYPDRERFPRRLVVAFSERNVDGVLTATPTLVSAKPNAFPDGRETIGEKTFGFTIGEPLGDPVRDNTRRSDAYRYHDAIHLAFVAFLGWSPTMRALLRLKRKSNKAVDDNEDGARAIYAEEGLAALLSRLAPSRKFFQSEETVDGDALTIAAAAAADLEVEPLPSWLWRGAIVAGFRALRELESNAGGYLTADLDARSLTFSKLNPTLPQP